MGKYAIFIWSSYGVGLGILGVLVLVSFLQLRRESRLVRRLESESETHR